MDGHRRFHTHIRRRITTAEAESVSLGTGAPLGATQNLSPVREDLHHLARLASAVRALRPTERPCTEGFQASLSPTLTE